MPSVNLSRAAVLASLLSAVAALGCGRNWQSTDGSWVQVGDCVVLRGGAEDPPERGAAAGDELARAAARRSEVGAFFDGK